MLECYGVLGNLLNVENYMKKFTELEDSWVLEKLIGCWKFSCLKHIWFYEFNQLIFTSIKVSIISKKIVFFNINRCILN